MSSSVAQDNHDSRQSPFLPEGQTEQGWPFVRGQNFDGHSAETNIAESWPDEGPPVLWSRALGQGYSGFVARGNRVYTQFQDTSGQYVVCLEASNGETIWSYRYDVPFEMHGLYPGPRATPTLADDKVYFAAPSGLIGCLSMEGRLLWSKNPKETYTGRGTDFGYACSPTVVRDKVILPVGGKGASMVALDAQSGNLIWKSGDDSSSYAPAMPITVNGQQQVIGYLENVIVGLDLEKGTPLWRVKLSEGYAEHAAWPIYDAPRLWFSGPFNAGSRLMRLDAIDQHDPEQVWRSKIMSNDVASSVLVDGYLYGFDLQDVQTKGRRPSRGSFRCIEFATGKQRWSNGEPKKRRNLKDRNIVGHASVIVADGKLIMLNDTGELILARATPERFEQLARARVFSDGICWTAPALHRGCVYVRDQNRAVCIYIGKSELLDRQLAAEAVTVRQAAEVVSKSLAETLGIESEYAFRAPTAYELRRWYVFTIALFVSLMVLGLLSYVLLRRRDVSWKVMRRTVLAVSFLTGWAGTTALSRWSGEFFFTWPLALFVACQWVLDGMGNSQHGSTPPVARNWLRTRIPGLIFVAIVIGYLLLCRRFGLYAEWFFLTGFIAALPCEWIRRRALRGAHDRPALDCLMLTGSYTAYYWASAGFLWLGRGLI